MYTIAVFLLVALGANALEVTTVTGPTPEPCQSRLSSTACSGKSDGNYEFFDKNTYEVVKKFFTQCSGGVPACQPCWPETLEFSPRCNQCLYNKNDDCYTTASWAPHSTFTCPDLCPQKPSNSADHPGFSGNSADPNNPFHYVGCWEGITVGCVVCPAGLKFNEKENACLYDGLYLTKPTSPY